MLVPANFHCPPLLWPVEVPLREVIGLIPKLLDSFKPSKIEADVVDFE